MSKIRSKLDTKNKNGDLVQRPKKSLSLAVSKKTLSPIVLPIGKRSPLLNHFVAFLLITSFFMQGVITVSANTDTLVENEPAPLEGADTDEAGTAPEEVLEAPTVVEREAEIEPKVVSEIEQTTEAEESPNPVPEAVVEETVIETVSPDTPENELPASENPAPEEPTTDTEDVSQPETPPEGSSQEVVAADSETEGVVAEEEVEANASSSEEVDSTIGEQALVSVTYSDSEVVFDKQSCTELASGSFYCQEAPEAEGLTDTLFASQDEGGDLEIYLVRQGEQFKVTDNNVDDAAPFYDQNTNTIVWHRLIDDRYQIISYDVEAGTEEQLTFTSTNNMEPTRQGEYIVWQRWIDTNWDIVLYFDGSEKVISVSEDHDIAPYVHGSLVVWNRYTSREEKTIEMYDIKNDTYVTVNDPEGMSVTNPRMVFVYDSLHPNGDIVTKGYDVLAREFIDLSTLPRPLPEEIPHSDSTGETRALIQNKPAVKTDVEERIADPEIGGEPEPSLSESENATSSELTLDLSNAAPSASSTPVVVEEPTSDFDLIIPPLTPADIVASTTSTETAVHE